MKLLLVSFALVGLVALALGDLPTTFDYHQRVGVFEAARIKKAEENFNFDGSRIVGGSTASLGQYPFLGGLVITLTNGATSVCGSSLLTNTKLVTAAHCWWDGQNQARQFVVVLGTTTLFTGGTRVTTTNVVMHEGWNPSTANNDVAIITVSWITYNNNISPVTLPAAYLNQNFVGWYVWAAGYGRTSDTAGIGTNQVVSHVQLQVITNAVCSNTFGAAIVDSTLCTDGAGGRGTCGGDSGGPVIVTTGGQNVLAGIVSFGSDRGCTLGFPSAHARATSFTSWIQNRL